MKFSSFPILLFSALLLLPLSACSVFRSTGEAVESTGAGVGHAIRGTGEAVGNGAATVIEGAGEAVQRGANRVERKGY